MKFKNPSVIAITDSIDIPYVFNLCTVEGESGDEDTVGRLLILDLQSDEERMRSTKEKV